MRINVMSKIISATFAGITRLTETKGKEYAEARDDKSDRLGNFKRGGADNNIHPYQYLMVLAGKHHTSIRDFVNRTARGEPPVGSEDIMARIDDMVLYMILLKCLIHDTEHRLLPIEVDRRPEAEVFDAILAERKFQDIKYGPPLGRGGHELAAWLLVVESELKEAKDAAMHGGYQSELGRNSVRAELVQIAAVCVAALEQHGVKELDNAKMPDGSATACGVDGSGRGFGGSGECAVEYYGKGGGGVGCCLEPQNDFVARANAKGGGGGYNPERLTVEERNATLDAIRQFTGERDAVSNGKRDLDADGGYGQRSAVDRSARPDREVAKADTRRFIPE